MCIQWPGTKESVLRVAFWNCGGFPVKPGEPKDHEICQTLLRINPDLMGLAECNLCWHKLPAHHRLRERIWGWFEKTSISVAYPNKFPAVSPTLAGGTTTLAINDSVNRVSSTDIDPSGLGRWSSILLKGKGHVSIRFVTAYRCVRNTKGPLSVWNQQRYLLDLQNCDEDPILKFDKDLFEALEKWHSQGEQVVLGIDLNEPVRTSAFTSQLRAKFGMMEVLTSKFQNTPHTYARGSQTIDGLFLSSSLKCHHCCYTDIVGDHRILWADITLSTALGFIPSKAIQLSPTRLKLQDPRVVKNYQMALNQFYFKHDLPQRMESLRAQCTSLTRHQLLREYNRLDALRTQGILYANKHCRRLKMGAVPYSPVVSQAGKMIRAWSLVVKKKSGRSVDSRYLHRKLKESNITHSHSISLAEAKSELRQAWLHYNNLKKRALQERSTWIEDLAAAKSSAGNISQEQEMRNLLIRERQRRDARLIRLIQNSDRQGLSSIEILSEDGWKEITNKADIEKVLCEELAARFNQARNSPFLHPTILRDTGPWASEAGAAAILNGTYEPPEDCDPWLRRLLPHLKYAFPSDTFSYDWSPIEQSQGWKRVKEKTSAGRSGITIPHMKANSLDPLLCLVDTIMAWLPFHFGFSPDRWQQGIDVMLEKKKGVRQVNKLRAILLYEADFNQNNKLLGKLTLEQAERMGAVAIEQFGSRKQLSAVDQSLNKALSFDLWRQNRQAGALCSNDAKSCYDRIVHNVASLCLQRVRVPIAPIQSMFETIQKLRHYIRTAYGDSDACFSGKDWDTPIQGVGQGNGAGPQIWALISTPIFNFLREERCGATFWAPISRETFFLAGYGFVDDTDLAVASPEIQSAKQAGKALQKSVDCWEGGIRVTGGALEPAKSLWYPVEFKWKNGEPTYKSITECEVEPIMMRNPKGEVGALQCLEPWQAERTLGVWLAPNGDMDIQFKYMENQATQWVQKLHASHLPRSLTRQAWLTTITKTLEFPLPVTTLSQKQCARLSSILISGILPRTGVVRTFPRALVHGPKEYFGLEIPDFFIVQGVSHITRLVRFSRAKIHPTASLLRTSAELFRVIIGCNGNLFQLSWQHFHQLIPTGWIKSTWEFCQLFRIQICDDIPNLKPWRENDVLLIPMFCQLGYSGKALKMLNMCRLFCRVSWLSEIVTGDGHRLLPFVLSGTWCCDTEDIKYPTKVTHQAMPGSYGNRHFEK